MTRCCWCDEDVPASHDCPERAFWLDIEDSEFRQAAQSRSTIWRG